VTNDQNGTVDSAKNTTTIIKTVSKDKSSDSTSKKTSDCGKFPSSGEHPAGANHPVVPAVAQVKSRMMNATSQN